MYTQEELSELIKYIEKHAKNKNFVRDYLKSGLSADCNLEGKMTPNLFKKFFYVPRDEQTLNSQIIKNVFEDETRNVIGLCAHGGSGKTVFLNLLQTEDPNSEFEYIIIDLDYKRGQTDPLVIVIQNVIHTIRKWLDPIFDRNTNAKYLFDFANMTQHIKSVLHDGDYFTLEDLWDEVCNIIFSSKNQDVADKIKILISSSSFSEIQNLAWEKGLQGVQVVCLLMMALILTKPNDNHKYIIAFDNIEAITSQDHAKLPQIILETWRLLRHVANLSDWHTQFFQRLTYVIAVRTTTKYSLSQGPNETFGAGNLNELDLPYSDFCAQAIRNKMFFLQNIPALKKTKLYKDMRLLCSMVCTLLGSEDDGIRSGDDKNYRYFSGHKLAPFFGNNFRQLVEQLCTIFDYPEKVERINSLLHPDEEFVKSTNEIKSIGVNGTRGILANTILQNLTKQLEYYDIHKIDGKVKHSRTRILLSFLYWNKVKFCISHGGLQGYSGVDLKQVLNVFKFFYPNAEIKTLVELIYRLSPFHNGNQEKKSQLNSWSYLIVINGIESDCSVAEFIEEALTDESSLRNEIEIDLSAAGLCYATVFSTHFEFFNARNQNESLFFYELEKNEGLGLYEFERIIDDNYQTLNRYVNAMIDNGKSGCIKYGINTPGQCMCDFLTGNRPLDIKQLLSCSMFMRYLEVSAAIIETINYIDRYRRLLWFKYKNPTINNKILDTIYKYANLLKEVREKTINSNIENKIPRSNGNLFFNSTVTAVLKNNNLIRLPHKAYYYDICDDDVIYHVLDKERKEPSGEDLFRLCKEFAKIL